MYMYCPMTSILARSNVKSVETMASLKETLEISSGVTEAGHCAF